MRENKKQNQITEKVIISSSKYRHTQMNNGSLILECSHKYMSVSCILF